MLVPIVVPRRCPQNHPCPLVFLCPTGAISQKGFGAPEIDLEKCIECGACSASCSYGAVLPDDQRAPLLSFS